MIITTNEPLRRLHPAVLRAGRCWSRLVFPHFPTDQANEWLTNTCCTRTVNEPTSLADLYAIMRGTDLEAPAPDDGDMIGFGRALPRA